MKKFIAVFLIFAVVVSLHSISSFGSEDSLEYTIQPRGFVAYELDGKTVTPFRTYQYLASEKVNAAIKATPAWLQDELFTTFENMDLCSIQTSDKSRPSFGDINGDGSKDLIVIDQKGIVRSQVVNDEPIGRNMDELVRVVDALQFFEEHGQVCPAGWNKGDKGMTTSPEGVAAYLSESAKSL